MKKSHKVGDILKEDCQSFGTIFAKALTLNKAFQYPIISVPLYIATLDGDFRQSEKASLRSFLINNSNAATSCIPEKVAWLIDGCCTVAEI